MAQQDPDFRPTPRWPGLTSPGAELFRLIGHEGPLTTSFFSPDGTRIITASHDKTARLWDALDGRELFVMRGHSAPVTCARFSPDGTRIVTASLDVTVRIWDPSNGREEHVLIHNVIDNTSPLSRPELPPFFPSDEPSTSSSGRNTEQFVGPLPPAPLMTASFSPDLTRIVTADISGVSQIWDAATGQKLVELHSDESKEGSMMPTMQSIMKPMSSVCFSSDGTRILTMSFRETVQLWDSNTGRELARLESDDTKQPGTPCT